MQICVKQIFMNLSKIGSIKNELLKGVYMAIYRILSSFFTSKKRLKT